VKTLVLYGICAHRYLGSQGFVSCQALVLVLLLYTVLGENTHPAQELFPLGPEAGGLLNGKCWVCDYSSWGIREDVGLNGLSFPLGPVSLRFLITQTHFYADDAKFGK